MGMSRRATEAAAESGRGSARSTSILNTNSRVSCSMLSCRIVLPIQDQNEVISFWYALMQTLSGSLPEPSIQQNWPCRVISCFDCAVSVQVKTSQHTINVVVY